MVPPGSASRALVLDQSFDSSFAERIEPVGRLSDRNIWSPDRLKELFKANRAIFSDLWIDNKWDWSKTNPVIHISFDDLSYPELGLVEALKSELIDIAERFDITLQKSDLKGRFKELLQKLKGKHGKVVLLIDEYDKPIIDYLETEFKIAVNTIYQIQRSTAIRSPDI